MTKYSLRARMMILILAPTLLIGLLLSIFFVVHRYNELRHQLVDAGANIIEPLAVSSEYGMTFHSKESVRQLVSLLHRRHSDIVRAISVFDDKNQLFVTSNYQLSPDFLRLPAHSALPDRLTFAHQGNFIILRTPIVSESYYPDESPGQDAKPTGNPLGYVAIELDLQSVRLQQYKEVFISTLLLLFCLAIAVLFAYRLMRDVTGPIRRMVNAVDRIRRGQLDSRVEGHMLGELDVLKNGINSMAMSLTAYHEEMQQNIDQATSDLRETLEQMEIQNVELDLAKKRAQEAARIKSEFLANMSHELRTPLNGVIGFTRQTLKTPLNATQRDYLHTIERSANNLLNIISDVLDFSKLEAGKLVLENIPFPLRNTLDEVIVLMAQSAHDKGLELTLGIHPDVPDNTIGDPLRLQQIIVNLIGNAIKFTERGNIDVRVAKRLQNDHRIELEIQVCDSGIGIAEKQQSQLFQAFRQADASTSRRHGGTGLGLVITQHLIKEMGGEIGFHSRLNQGSTFWFHINLALNPNALANAQPLSCVSGKTLAYVEANSHAAEAVLDMLGGTPLSVSYSASLSTLKTADYDTLLLSLPSGRDFSLQQLCDMLTTATTRARSVILALPCPLQIYAEELKSAGASACLIKPITLTRLIPVLIESHTRQNNGHLPSARLPLTVMAVDDNPANLKLIGALLEEQVEHTLLCESGKAAVREAQLQRPDIILMDIQMPDIDGIRASKMIRALPGYQHTPIVAVTAHALEGEREELIAAGMNDYLAKPINEAELSQLLAHYAPGAAQKIAEPPASLDWQLALQQAANKPGLACDLLQMLLEFLPEVRCQVEASMAQNDPISLRDIIHKLHGSASYSGVPRLKQLCQQIEHSLRSNGRIEDIEPELFELLDEMKNVARLAAAHLKH
ncbi:two-component sensor histidine kinase BarA [Erwinia sp. OLTSP20]|uniref:two-component sensor histidine kinase BarA n=1 Tax=unclassified Erwinia TaxID=2622719 RepID=UPI000C19967A|nr:MULTISPECIES: two-component sensor histidine kinase BarA [unclassified Erwinia]PIJ49061.1 two-component sensor histidine kinase BarA [Erwinia sp. OAMSP11]PIJ75055.1 two-component sensor histidine kinase BarA [Erwinia sp. OLSSP12]PIJ79746.1 two-component sensor histidine kinase BarA [Erwinia sp. OLCASP19]PIJ80531.1 two-component sensor histidine kinase BarA [Erwinia sp. OLMTSP26]PIJ82645.1 two-component sensor histidine kinase BarA [Erwinia sp. OLMDSP33]